MARISEEDVRKLEQQFRELIGLRVDWLSIPERALAGFEPSQIAVIINTLFDAALPQITLLASDPANVERLRHIGLSKSPGLIGQREGYPDYVHTSGKRVELKGLFVDSPDLALKRPPTRREPSARVKENVTAAIVDPERDVMLVAAVQLKEISGRCYPVVTDIGVFPMIEVVEARDRRLAESGGRWFGKVPRVPSRAGMVKLRRGEPLEESDFERDTNFGKLKRIPYEPLQSFMRKHGAI
jgi:hypothetical protein